MVLLRKIVIIFNFLLFATTNLVFAKENSILFYITSNLPFYNDNNVVLDLNEIELKQKAIKNVQYNTGVTGENSGVTHRGNLDKAISYLKQAINLVPEQTSEMLQLQLSLFSLEIDTHQHKQAKQTLKLLLKDFPDDPIVQVYEIAYLDLLKQRNYNESLQKLQQLNWPETPTFIKAFKIIQSSFYLQINTNANQMQIQSDSTPIIVILGYSLNKDGSMKNILIKRLNKGLETYQQYPNSTIIVSGGAPRSGVTESYKIKQWLINHKVPANKIIQEDKSISTVWKAINTFKILQTLPNAKDIVLVTSASHIRRINAVFKQQNINTDLNIKIHNVVSGVKGYNILMPISEDEKILIIKDTLRIAGIWQMPGMVF